MQPVQAARGAWRRAPGSMMPPPTGAPRRAHRTPAPGGTMTETMQHTAPLRIGDKAPDFSAETTHGPMKFSEWAGGNWVILFSHPADFTPVCTTEFVGFAERADQFAKRGVKLI